MAASSSSATVRSCTAEFCRMSSRARWKPKQSTARRSSRSRPRAITRALLRCSERCEHVEIGLQLPDAVIRRGLADRPPHDLDLELLGGGGQPRIDAATPPADTARRSGAATCRASARPARATPRRHRRDGPRSTAPRRAHAAPRDRIAARGSTAAAACRASRPR